MVRNGKRVRALRRAPDGSGFQNCDECGVAVPIALADMHNCILKRFKPQENTNTKIKEFVYQQQQQPRSPFLFFMESYGKTCKARDLVEVNRKAFQKWKNMSTKEQWPFVLQAQKVENAYLKLLHQEMNQMSQGKDDEADSSVVGKFAPHFEDYEYSDSSDRSECCDTCDWPLMCPWHRL